MLVVFFLLFLLFQLFCCSCYSIPSFFVLFGLVFLVFIFFFCFSSCCCCCSSSSSSASSSFRVFSSCCSISRFCNWLFSLLISTNHHGPTGFHTLLTCPYLGRDAGANSEIESFMQASESAMADTDPQKAGKRLFPSFWSAFSGLRLSFGEIFGRTIYINIVAQCCPHTMRGLKRCPMPMPPAPQEIRP